MGNERDIKHISIQQETTEFFKRDPRVYGTGPENIKNIITNNVFIITFADGTVSRQTNIEIEFLNEIKGARAWRKE